MEEAQVEFCTFLESFSYKVPQVSVIANYTAEPYADDSIVDNLKQQLTHSVRWVQSMQYVLAQGDDVSCVELGPGKVLTGLLKRIR
jgi:malonyl CoA-acyl carrier protein transacylase